MAGRLIDDASLRDRTRVFSDRKDAGTRLASFLKPLTGGGELVLAIPAGGVPVASEISRVLSLGLDLLISRKVQIPGNPEAGFGALDPEGGAVFNRPLIKRLGLGEPEIELAVRKTRDVIRQRERLFRGGVPFPDLYGRVAIIVDDGLASGFTMLSSVRFARKKKAKSVLVAVPTCHRKSAESVAEEADCLVCLNIRGGLSFAVADAYLNWRDVSDGEVLEVMEQTKLW